MNTLKTSGLDCNSNPEEGPIPANKLYCLYFSEGQYLDVFMKLTSNTLLNCMIIPMCIFLVEHSYIEN